MLSTIRAVVIVAVAALVLVVVPGLGQAQLVLYDNFNVKPINPNKWQGGEFGFGNTETARRIEEGELVLSMTSYGMTNSNTGTAGTAGTRLSVTNPADVTTLQAAVSVISTTVSGCMDNVTPTRARAQVTGAFFNDSTGPVPALGNRTGDILAGIQKVRDSILGDRIEAFLNRCTNAACSFPQAQLGFHVFVTVWDDEDADTLRVQWDPDNNRFLYALNPGTRREETAELKYTLLVDNLPPVAPFKQLAVTNSVASCMAGRKSASMKASFDKVRVNP